MAKKEVKKFDPMETLNSLADDMRKHENEKFEVYAAVERDSIWGKTILLHITHNGYQYSTIGIHTKAQLKKVINVLESISEDSLPN